MTKQPCDSCGGLGGSAGPCPQCGELPGVEVLGTSEPSAVGTTRVTTRRSVRRVAVAVVAVLAVVVGLSLVWDGERSGDEAAADEEVERDRSTTTTRRRSTTTVAPSAHEHPGEVVPLDAPVGGFEGQTLLVISTVSGAWQVPLDGGEPVYLGRVRDGEMQHLVDGSLVGYEGGLSLRDGSRWQWDLASVVAETESTASVPMFPGWLIGPTDRGTILWGGEGLLVELTVAGDVVGTQQASELFGLWTFPRTVVGRSAVYEGPHGLLAFDVDSGALRRLAVGGYVATAGNRILIEACDDQVRCAMTLVDVVSGEVILQLDGSPAPRSTSSLGTWSEPSASPDGERLALLLEEDQLAVFDLTSGRRLGMVAIPQEALEPGEFSGRRVQVLWSSDSQAALVLVTGQGGPREQRPLHFAAWVHRDGERSEYLDHLAAVVRHLARSSGDVTLFVTAERFTPWAEP